MPKTLLRKRKRKPRKPLKPRRSVLRKSKRSRTKPPKKRNGPLLKHSRKLLSKLRRQPKPASGNSRKPQQRRQKMRPNVPPKPQQRLLKSRLMRLRSKPLLLHRKPQKMQPPMHVGCLKRRHLTLTRPPPNLPSPCTSHHLHWESSPLLNRSTRRLRPVLPVKRSDRRRFPHPPAPLIALKPRERQTDKH